MNWSASSALISTLFFSLCGLIYPEQGWAQNTVASGQQPIAAIAYKRVEKRPAQPVALEDAVNIALQNYPSLQAAHARLGSAIEGIALAKTKYIPRAHLFSQTNVGNNGKLPGVLFPQLGVLPVQGNAPQTTSYQPVFGTWDGALLEWDVYDFGLRHAQVQEATVKREEALAQENLTRFDIAYNTSRYFLEAIAAQENIKATKANLERARLVFSTVSALVDSGLRPGVDKVRVGTEFIRARTEVVRAIHQAEVANIRLATAMGLPGQSVLIDRVPFTEEIQSIPDPLMKLPVLTSHPVLNVQKQKVTLAQVRQTVASHTDLPTISLWGGLNGRGSGYSPDANEIHGGLSGTYPTRLQLAAALVLTYTPTDFFAARDKERIEQFNEQAAKDDYDTTLEELLGNLGESRKLFESAQELTQYTPVQVESAKAALEQSIARYQSGLSNIVEVADAERLLYQSEVEDNKAHIQVWAALLQIARHQGSLEPFLKLVKAKRGG